MRLGAEPNNPDRSKESSDLIPLNVLGRMRCLVLELMKGQTQCSKVGGKDD